MKTCRSACFLCLVLCAALSGVRAATRTIGLGETLVLEVGGYLDKVVVQNGGVFVMDGGAVGTNPVVYEASVEIAAGGRFVMNGGEIKYFDNRGIVELYGGHTWSWSSENRGYVKVAGGDLGPQLVHFDGVVDVYYPAASRQAWEIDAEWSNPLDPPEIRVHGLENRLPAGEYGVGDLSPLEPGPPPSLALYEDRFMAWTPWGEMKVYLDLLLSTNWNGRIFSIPYTAPAAPTADILTAIEVSWDGQTGRTYQVQCATSLVKAVWSNLGLPVVGLGEPKAAFDAMREPAKFYRVVVRQ